MTGRNSPCPCGSTEKDGKRKKYKKCCGKFATKGGKFAAKPNIDKLMGTPPRPEDMMGLISRELWRELHIPDGDELVRREAIRKQGFR